MESGYVHQAVLPKGEWQETRLLGVGRIVSNRSRAKATCGRLSGATQGYRATRRQAGGLGDEPRRIFEELGKISLVDLDDDGLSGSGWCGRIPETRLAAIHTFAEDANHTQRSEEVQGTAGQAGSGTPGLVGLLSEGVAVRKVVACSILAIVTVAAGVLAIWQVAFRERHVQVDVVLAAYEEDARYAGLIMGAIGLNPPVR